MNILSLLSPSVSGPAAALLLLSGTVTHAQDASVPGSFPDIQSAVERAVDLDGDGRTTVLVRAGVYAENVLIQRSDLVLVGDGAGMTELRGTGFGSTVRVHGASRVTLRGLRITGAGSGSGVELVGTTDCSVERCVVTRNLDGVSIRRSAGARVRGNQVFDNAGTGVQAVDVRKLSLLRNEVWDNGRHGVFVGRATASRVERNLVRANGHDGFHFHGVRTTSIVQNLAKENLGDGLRLEKGRFDDLRGNVSMFNGGDGLHMHSTADNVISGNAFAWNREWGIHAITSSGDDFDVVDPGMQSPPGTNDVTANGYGPFLGEA